MTRDASAVPDLNLTLTPDYIADEWNSPILSYRHTGLFPHIGIFDIDPQPSFCYDKGLISHFDNSPANRFNPDAAKLVVWGPQNWDEMSNCFIGVLFDRSTAPEKVFLRSGPSMLPRGVSGPTLEAFNAPGADVAAPVTNGGTGGAATPER